MLSYPKKYRRSSHFHIQPKINKRSEGLSLDLTKQGYVTKLFAAAIHAFLAFFLVFIKDGVPVMYKEHDSEQ